MTNHTHPSAPSRSTASSTRLGPVTDPGQIHTAFLSATNAHDVDALLALYDPEGVAVQLDGGEARGEDEMRAMVEGLTTAITRIDGATRKLFVVGDLALSSGTWTAQVVLPDGSTVEQRGTTAEVSRRQPDGTWRLVIDDPMFV